MSVICIILALAAIIGSQASAPRPRLIEWDEAEQRFSSPATGAEEQIPSREGVEYLEAYFARKYIGKMFTISASIAENELAWCPAPQGKSAAGIWTGEKCWLAMASAADVYNSFVAEQKTAFSNLARTGYTRRVEIKSAEPARAAYIRKAERSIFDFILSSRIVPDRRMSEYRVEFDLVGSDKKRSAIVGFVSITSNVGSNNFSVSAASFMWGREP
jgi:hypothetical protein